MKKIRAADLIAQNLTLVLYIIRKLHHGLFLIRYQKNLRHQHCRQKSEQKQQNHDAEIHASEKFSLCLKH